MTRGVCRPACSPHERGQPGHPLIVSLLFAVSAENPCPSRPSNNPLPSDLVPDALSRYIYRHFPHLLTNEERTAHRVWIGRTKQLLSSDPTGSVAIKFFRLWEVQAKYPELMRRIEVHGVAHVMRVAAERVVRDNPDQEILHTCARCGELCRTPVAQQCFACGLDWHAGEGG